MVVGHFWKCVPYSIALMDRGAMEISGHASYAYYHIRCPTEKIAEATQVACTALIFGVLTSLL